MQEWFLIATFVYRRPEAATIFVRIEIKIQSNYIRSLRKANTISLKYSDVFIRPIFSDVFSLHPFLFSSYPKNFNLCLQYVSSINIVLESE